MSHDSDEGNEHQFSRSNQSMVVVFAVAKQEIEIVIAENTLGTN